MVTISSNSTWKKTTLGEIFRVFSGKGLSSKSATGSGFPVYGGNGINGYHKEFLFEEPKLIIGRVGAKCGVTHITHPKSWVTDNALIVNPIIADFDLQFFALRLAYENLNKLSVSTAQPVISGNKIYSCEILLPTLNEQRSIVSKIESLFSELDKGIETLKTAQQKLKTYRQSVLKWAFEGRLTNESVKDGELPEGWSIQSFGNVTKNHNGKRIPLSRTIRSTRKGNYRYYGATEVVDMIDDYIFDGRYLLIGEDGANLLSKSRPLAFIAEGQFWVNNHAHIVQPTEDLNIHFLNYFINSLSLTRYVTGTAQPKLTQGNLNKIPVPYPKLSEQESIVEILESRRSVADKMEESITESLQQAEALRQSILKRAFEGKLV